MKHRNIKILNHTGILYDVTALTLIIIYKYWIINTISLNIVRFIILISKMNFFKTT